MIKEAYHILWEKESCNEHNQTEQELVEQANACKGGRATENNFHLYYYTIIIKHNSSSEWKWPTRNLSRMCWIKNKNHEIISDKTDMKEYLNDSDLLKNGTKM